ncbi:MAG: hypothetical protein JNM44_08600 [Chitinophagaceae bacterium]|nr:hypothetical protein [Chitinophagaceae bacterium]
MLQQILEILKYVLPAVVVLVAAYLIVNKFLVGEMQQKQLALFGQHAQYTIQVRLQAYERLTIFVERMHPTNLISRHYIREMSAQDVQLAMVRAIRDEYEHNLSQQIYVSREVWQTVKAVMEQEITMLNRIGSNFAMGAPSADFVKALSEYVVNTESTMPTAIALETIDREAKKLLTSAS